MDNLPNDFSGMPPPANTAAAREAVSGPAILLLVTAGLGIVGALLGLVVALVGSAAITAQQIDQLNQMGLGGLVPLLENSSSGGTVFRQVLVLALSGVTLFGALKMKDLRNFGLSTAAAIIAIIPCIGPCCCMGIPAGIWALVVINKPEVKSAFRP
jgi:hypothetical protein